MIALAVAASSLGLASPAAAATTTLPNLKMAHIRDLTIQVQNGRRLLRFTTIMLNLGAGRFEVRGRRASTSDPVMTIDQRIYNDAGGSAYYPTKGTARYAGDGHDHWHVQQIMTYELYQPDAPAGARRGAKSGFCFFDTTPWSLGLPNASQSSYYREEWCGTRDVLTNRTGISVGWGDRYPWNFAYQWIDITGMPAGAYLLRATVDQQNWYREQSNNDNCVWARITIPATGSTVGVQARGSDCGPESVRPVTTFPGATAFDPPRRVAFAAGTYVGYRFNSIGTVLDTKRGTLSRSSGASTSARGIPIAQPTNWFYIVDGLWAGYWVKDTAAVGLAP
jgi:hypothetical protein